MKRYYVEGILANTNDETAILFETDSLNEAEVAKKVLVNVLRTGRIENKFDGRYDTIIDVNIIDNRLSAI